MLALAHDRDYIAGMDNPLPGDNAQHPETDADRKRRIAWEAEMIAEADADIEAGRLVEPADVKRWIDSVGTAHELPVPYFDRRSGG
jgi:hypothetical protein